MITSDQQRYIIALKNTMIYITVEHSNNGFSITTEPECANVYDYHSAEALINRYENTNYKLVMLKYPPEDEETAMLVVESGEAIVHFVMIGDNFLIEYDLNHTLAVELTSKVADTVYYPSLRRAEEVVAELADNDIIAHIVQAKIIITSK